MKRFPQAPFAGRWGLGGGPGLESTLDVLDFATLW